jgi:cyclase
VRFRDHEVAGSILELAARYRDEGADELVFYDIAASPKRRLVDVNWVRRVTELLDIPFCVAGGIRTLADAEAVLAAGADKISINSPALENPKLIEDLAMRFGSQCVVVGIDSLQCGKRYRAYALSGDPESARDGGREVSQWVREVQERGAGEIVLNCVGSDGVREGYDVEHLSEIRAICRVPLVASGGAGAVAHFADVFTRANVDSALAATVFHSGAIRIPALKQQLLSAGIPVRLT